MDFAPFRKLRGLSLSEAARELDIGSRGYLHDLESGRSPWTLRLALKIERWSEGQVSAESLVTDADRELLAAHRANERTGIVRDAMKVRELLGRLIAAAEGAP